MQTSLGRTIAIGDIHGCIHALEALLAAIQPTPQDQLICLGDFIDTGRDTRDVVTRLIRLQGECDLVVIQGNHEEMLLAALQSAKLKDAWLMCGGIATLNSYKFCGDIDVIDQDHLAFIRQTRDYFETDTHILVHANYEEQLPLADLPSYALRWSILESKPRLPHVSGKRVIVGHTEQRSGEILDLGGVVCIDTYCHGHGWLTALELNTNQVWQASRWGVLRESGEDAGHLTQAMQLLQPRAD
jgi:serine/threonine protein phosphatase 1